MFEDSMNLWKARRYICSFIFLAVEVEDGSKNEEFKIIFKQVKKFGIP